ncbi:Proto-oncogene Mas, partial [Lamprotornis superbus]
VTNVAIHSVTLLICLCGLAGNGAVLWLLGSRHVSRNFTTTYILMLTFIDVLFLLFLIPSSLLFLLEGVSCSVIMPLQYVWLLFQMDWVFYCLWLYPLTAISILRCRSMHCPLWHCCHHPQHLSWVVHSLFGAFSITLITLFATWASLCAFLPPEHCWVSLISMYAFNLLLCAPFMLISITILYIKVKSGSHQQQPKSLDIVICLAVLLTLPFSLRNLLQVFGYTIFSFPVAFLLTCIHSSIKPFIYLLVGRCWRHCSVGSLRLSLQRGDDLCEIVGTNVAIHSVTLLICLCGLAGNAAVIWVLGFHLKRDTMKPITAYILDLAIINFLFLIFMLPSTLLFLLEDVSCSLFILPGYISFLFLLFVMFYSVGLYRLTAISIERCRAILCPRDCFFHLPQDLSWVVVSAVLWALSITVIAAISAVTSLCQSQERKHCQGALISLYTLNFLVFAPSVVISSTILFINFKGMSQQHQVKKLDIIVFLVVLFALPISVWNFLQQLGYTTVSPQVVLLFACLHSSINPFIYFSVTKCWRLRSMEFLRDCLQRIFEEPEENTACRNDANMDTVI